jgi:hypothetical protein
MQTRLASLLDVPSATFSPCRTYRYTLMRQWESGTPDFAVFIGLNPSTADEVYDDPTIRRCIGFARSWGMGGLVMLNLFAFRATRPADMFGEVSFIDIVGPENDGHISDVCDLAQIVVAAWGNHGKFMGRDAKVRALVPGLQVLRLNKDGSPAHPLYLPARLTPIPWKEAA